MSTHELTLWIGASFTLSPLIHSAISDRAIGTAAFAETSAIGVIAWGCVAILWFRDEERRQADLAQIVTVLLLLAAGAVAPGKLTFIPLSLLGLVLATRRNWSGKERRIGIILTALAAQALWSKVVSLLLVDWILRIDTALAGMAMQLFVPGSVWTANTIKPPNDVGIVVYLPCSSFANLSLVALCYVSISALDGAVLSWRNIIAIFGAFAAIVVLNTIRLLLMAKSLGQFEYWHNGNGSQVFAVGMSVSAVVLCSLGSRWANARRS